MRPLILPGTLHWLLRELAPLVPCAALILIARRLPVVHFGSIRLHLAAPIVCAVALWAGPFTAIAGTLLACFAEARLLVRDRAGRIAVLVSGATLAAAAGAACIAARFAPAAPAVQAAGLPTIRACIAAWQHAIPAILTFLAVYAAASRALETPQRNRKLSGGAAGDKMRAGVALAGFTALAAAVPLGAAFGLWALLPLACLLIAEGLLMRRAFEISGLKRQLAVSRAMGLASLAEAATAEPTALLYRFLHLAQDLVHAERSLVWMLDDVNGDIIPAAGLPDMGEFAGLRTRLGEGLIGTAAERTRPLIVSDAARTLRRGENEPAADSWLLYPIISQKKVLGVAHWTRPASMPFTPEDAAQLEGLVPHVGVAVESLRTRNKMRELAATDGLTGLYNHRRICELLREEMRRAERYNRPLSVLMLDLDSFKSFNDAYGHPSGDQLLRSVAQLLRSGVRTVDRVGRYGGEEFIIIMPETHKDDAFLLAERLRSTIEQRAFIVVAGEEIHRTVSAGVASYPEDGLNPQEVIQSADEALYRAKDSGRNCVIWA
jgi:diguanylate cyclase (GGDEF)-like protein